MEQYEISPAVYYESIRKALDNFQVKRIFIRCIDGSIDREVVVNEDLNGKTLDIIETSNGLSVVINSKECFLFEFIRDRGLKWWVMAYFRRHDICLSTGVNPDDETLPPVKESILRGANPTHLMEITFEGKIPLRVHFPKDGYWDLWEIDV